MFRTRLARRASAGPRCRRSAPLALLLLAASTIGAAAAPPSGTSLLRASRRFQNLSTDDGLPGDQVAAILEDRLGFLWFGTDSGLARYDSSGFEVYRHDPHDAAGLSSSTVTALLADRDGDLWVGTVAGLDRMDRRTGVVTAYRSVPGDPRGLSSDRVRCLAQDRAGSIWVGTLGGLDRLDPRADAFRRYRHNARNPASLADDRVWAVLEDRAGTIWVGTSAGLDRFDVTTGAFEHCQGAAGDLAGLGRSVVTALLEDVSGTLWAGTERGLYCVDRGARRLVRPDGPAGQEPLASAVVRALAEDGDTLHVATDGSGLVSWDRAKGEVTVPRPRPADPPGTSVPPVLSLCLDRNGILWTGTADRGVSRLDPRAARFTQLVHDPADPGSLSASAVNALLEDSRGDVWVGTANGGLNRYDRATGRFERFAPDPGDPLSLGSAAVTSLLEDPTGALWVGTWGAGLDRLDPASRSFTHLRHRPDDLQGLNHDLVSALARDRAGHLWVGTFGGGLGRLDTETGRFVQYRRDPGRPDTLGDDRVLSLLVDREGRLWIGLAEAGLDRLDPGSSTFVHTTAGGDQLRSLSHPTVSDILEGKDGGLWLATGGGLDRLDPITGDVTHLGRAEGLADDKVQALLEVDLPSTRGGSFLWVGTDNGLSRVDPRTRLVRSFDRRDGLPTRSFRRRARLLTSRGEVLFGGSSGLVAFDPGRLEPNPRAPRVVLTRLEVLEQEVVPGPGAPLSAPIEVAREVTLGPDQPVFTISFAALSFYAPGRTLYEHRLEGVEAEWVRTGSDRRSATYTTLAPGRYLFRVRAANEDGVWNRAGASITVVVLPPWWKTAWARVAAAILVLFVGTGAFRWRVRAMRSRTQELETLVAARSAELLESGRAMRTLLANLPGLAYRCRDDESFTMEFVSDGCLALTGYPPEALVGNAQVAFADLIEADDLPSVRDEVARAIAERRAYQMTYRLVSRDGRQKWVWEKGEAVRDAAGAVVALEGFITDLTERHVAEERLRKLYRAVEQSPSTIVITALDGTIELVNPAFTRTTGYTADEAIGQNPRVLKSGKVPPAVYEDLWRTVTRGDVWEGDLLNRRKDGSLYWEHAVISPVRDASGRVTHYAAVKEDITQRRRAEEALKLEEHRLRSLYELSRREFASEEELGREAIAGAARLTEARFACLFLVEPELRLLATSGTAQASELGCAPGRAETASREAARLGHPILGDDHSLACAAAEACGAGHVAAVPVVDRGRAVAVCCVCRTDDSLGERDAFQLQAYIDGVYRILAKRRVEEALRKRTGQLDALRQVGLSLMAELEPERLLQSIARWAADLLGATSGEVRLTPSGDAPTRRPAMPDAESVVSVPIRWRNEELGVLVVRSGKPRRFSQEDTRLLELFALQAAVAIKNASLFAQVTSDAQEKETLLRKEQEAREAAVAASRAKGVFLASMSHELRTPLNAILGFSQLMARDPKLAPMHRENLETISRSGEHLLALINDVLDLSKIEAGRMEVVVRDFDLGKVLEDLHDLFRQRAESKGLSLSIERSSDVPRFVRTDRTRLRQVLINLLGNAVKFTEAGGVTVRVSWVPAQGGPPALRFEVEDTGIGIPPSHAETVFEPFGQAPGGQAAGEGTGLGLTISRHWVRLMGGELTFESEGVPGKGTRFVFTVPVEVAGQNPPVTPVTGIEVPPASLHAMTRAWRDALARAAREGDVSEMARLLAALRARDEALAGRLEALVDDFAYDEILGLVEGAKEGAGEGR